MNGQYTHTDWTLLPLGHFPNRANIKLFAKIELASTLVKFLHDALALIPMLTVVVVLTISIAITNALAPVAFLDSITFLSARRASQFD